MGSEEDELMRFRPYSSRIAQAMPPDDHMSSRTNRGGWSKNIEMDGLESSGSTLDRSQVQTPTQADFSHNPSLTQSRHNPANGFLKAIAEVFANRNSDGSIFIPSDKANTLFPLLEVEMIASVQTLSLVEKITARLDSFEKSLNSVVNSAPKSSSAWSSVMKKNNPVNLPINTARPPPANRVLNEFKPGFLIIRKSVPDSRPFSQMSSPEITTKVNSVLNEIKAKTDDGSTISVKGVARLPSGDFKFFTQSRFAANWLLEHKHEWTHLCDPTLITPPSTFPCALVG
ncbi:hypothetical protein PGT21_025977 [Puccinia graminis f. sp. tritici]|uniref:Uncharacterized protein n=1 Tax=Puccinia graminis f. sp. tritici TaxID=56615 RepID=A0A5B0MLU5_PUCGR|nr:hypothetical protein PGT21_025977 [Puccinia graminis f. sp. tritici]